MAEAYYFDAPASPPPRRIAANDSAKGDGGTHDQATTDDGRVLLFYKYVEPGAIPQATVAALVAWQRRICGALALTGRIRVATEGINGTVGGAAHATALYKRATAQYPPFAAGGGVDWKESAGAGAGAGAFRMLEVSANREIIHLGIDPARLPHTRGGEHLSPDEWDAALARGGSHGGGGAAGFDGGRASDRVVLVDCRNAYESDIGHFRGAVRLPTRKFSDFPRAADALVAARALDREPQPRVLMYCTGGIRCERASAYLRARCGLRRVGQLRGGVHRYLEQRPGGGQYVGRNFVFV